MGLIAFLIKSYPATLSKIVAGAALGPQLKALGIDFGLAAGALSKVAASYRGEVLSYLDIDEQQLAEGVGELIPILLEGYAVTEVTTTDLGASGGLVEQLAARCSERVVPAA